MYLLMDSIRHLKCIFKTLNNLCVYYTIYRAQYSRNQLKNVSCQKAFKIGLPSLQTNLCLAWTPEVIRIYFICLTFFRSNSQRV